MPYYGDWIGVEATKDEYDDPYNGYDEKNAERRDLKHYVIYEVDETERED